MIGSEKIISYSKFTFLLLREGKVFIVNQASGKEIIYSIESLDIFNEIKNYPRSINDIYKAVYSQFLPHYKDLIIKDIDNILNQLELEGFIDVCETSTKKPKLFKTFSLKNFIPKLSNITIELTNRCNEKCIHCFLGENKFKNSHYLDLESLKKIITQFVNMGGTSITFTGGEILIYPHIKDVLEYSHSYGLGISLFSNLISLNQDHIDLFKKLNINDIQTSLYSHIPATHNKITNLKNSCEKTINSIKKLRKAGLPIRIACPVMKANRNDIIGVIKFCKQNSLDLNIDISIQGQCDGNLENLAQRLSLEEMKETLMIIKNYDRDFCNRYVRRHCHNKNISPIEFINLPICSAGHDNLYINSNGDVSACPTFQGYRLGNLKHEDLHIIWTTNKKLLEIRNSTQTSFPECLNCDCIEFCGRCFAINFVENKDIWKVPKYRCKLAKIQKEISEIG